MFFCSQIVYLAKPKPPNETAFVNKVGLNRCPGSIRTHTPSIWSDSCDPCSVVALGEGSLHNRQGHPLLEPWPDDGGVDVPTAEIGRGVVAFVNWRPTPARLSFCAWKNIDDSFVTATALFSKVHRTTTN